MEEKNVARTKKQKIKEMTDFLSLPGPTENLYNGAGFSKKARTPWATPQGLDQRS